MLSRVTFVVPVVTVPVVTVPVSAMTMVTLAF